MTNLKGKSNMTNLARG